MEGVTGMMARLSHMQRVAAGGSAMYRTRVFFSFRVTAAVATSQKTKVHQHRKVPEHLTIPPSYHLAGLGRAFYFNRYSEPRTFL